MKKVWHKSLNFYLSPYKRDTEEGDRLRWQRAECRLLHLPFHSLSAVPPLEPTKAKGNLPITFKAFTQLQKCQKRVLETRNTNPSPANKWNIPVAHILYSDLGPSVPKFLENRDGHDALCLGNGFSSSSEEQLQLSVLWVVHEGQCDFEQMLHKTLILYPNCKPSQIHPKQVCWKIIWTFSKELPESFLSNMVQLRDYNKTMVTGAFVPPFGLVQSLHEFYPG